MKHADIKALMAEIAPVIKEFTDKATAPLMARIAELEAASVEEKAQRRGNSEVRQMVDDGVTAALKAYDYRKVLKDELPALLATGEKVFRDLDHAKEVIKEEIAAVPAPTLDIEVVRQMVADAVAAIPPAKDGERGEDGKSVTLEDILPLIDEKFAELDSQMVISIGGGVEEAVKALPPPEKGADADPELVRSLVAEAVERSLAAWERPQNGKDGESVTVEQVLPVILTHIDRTIEALPKAKDGLDAVSFVVDEEGHLNVTMSNGAVKDLGKFRGKDCDMAAVSSQVKELFDAWPKPKDGADGIGFENMEIETREDGVYQTWTAGAEKKEVRIPSLIYRGTWKADQVYKRGDFVTWAGGMWFCKTETTAKPEPSLGEAKDWTLAVKRGDDARLPKVKI